MITRSLWLLPIALTAAEAPALAPSPMRPGQCVPTSVRRITGRLETLVNGRYVGDPSSGTAVFFADGHYMVGYEANRTVAHWRSGDPIRLCLLDQPTDCPPGDDRGQAFRATNLRTGYAWSASNSEHGCGGA